MNGLTFGFCPWNQNFENLARQGFSLGVKGLTNKRLEVFHGGGLRLNSRDFFFWRTLQNFNSIGNYSILGVCMSVRSWAEPRAIIRQFNPDIFEEKRDKDSSL